MVISTEPCAAFTTHLRSGTTPVARWNASSRSICGIDSAIGE